MSKNLKDRSPQPPGPCRSFSSAAPRRWRRVIGPQYRPVNTFFRDSARFSVIVFSSPETVRENPWLSGILTKWQSDACHHQHVRITPKTMTLFDSGATITIWSPMTSTSLPKGRRANRNKIFAFSRKPSGVRDSIVRIRNARRWPDHPHPR